MVDYLICDIWSPYLHSDAIISSCSEDGSKDAISVESNSEVDRINEVMFIGSEEGPKTDSIECANAAFMLIGG